MLIPLVNEEESYYELYAESAWDLELMRVPNLFAFVCKNPLHIPMQARVSKITSKDDTPLLSDGKKQCVLYLNFRSIKLKSKEYNYNLDV